MPTTIYDRSLNTQDFEMVDLRAAAQVEFISDASGRCWLNVNGKCLFRAGYCEDIVVEIPKGKASNVSR